jgi:uncharacterized membrane protein
MRKEELLHPVHKIERTFGQKAADNLTIIIGSWKFIIIFILFIFFWILANTLLILFQTKWDPHPFMLLNVILAIITAIQAPIILMSQNRKAQRDRIVAEYDYKINQKSERQIEEIKRQLERIEKRLK